MKNSIVSTLILALAALGMHGARAGDTLNDVSARAQQVLSAEMGDLAKDLTVTVDQHGVATLEGWAKGPKEVVKASYLVSRVPGVSKAYGSMVHTWTTTDRY